MFRTKTQRISRNWDWVVVVGGGGGVELGGDGVGFSRNEFCLLLCFLIPFLAFWVLLQENICWRVTAGDYFWLVFLAVVLYIS